MLDSKTLSHKELRSDRTRHGPALLAHRNAALNPHPGVNAVSALRVRPDNSLARLSGFAVLSLLGSLVSPARATAQGCAATACRATNVVQATVGTIMRLTVNGSTTVVASPSPAAYTAGHDAVAGPTAIVKSNGRWKLQISAAEPTWDAADAAARTDKPASDLRWSTLPSGQYTSVATTPSDVAEGGATAGTPLPLHYRAQFDQTSDASGSYTLVVKLTLVGA